MSLIKNAIVARPSLARLEERRAVRRKVAEIVVHVVTPSGTYTAEIKDVSIHGCSLSYDKAVPKLGQIVKIARDGIDPAAGIIRWVRDGIAGLEFLRPLSSSHALLKAPAVRPE